jgi:L-lactate utilization protein LutC
VAVAETGTIILDAGPGQGRRVLTLLPDYHLCVVRADQIVATLAEGLARLDPTRPDPRPGSAAHRPPAISNWTGSKASTAPEPWRFDHRFGSWNVLQTTAAGPVQRVRA